MDILRSSEVVVTHLQKNNQPTRTQRRTAESAERGPLFELLFIAGVHPAYIFTRVSFILCITACGPGQPGHLGQLPREALFRLAIL